MNPKAIHKMQSQFDTLAQQHLDELTVEFWFARDLQESLGYALWESTPTPVPCENSLYN